MLGPVPLSADGLVRLIAATTAGLCMTLVVGLVCWLAVNNELRLDLLGGYQGAAAGAGSGLLGLLVVMYLLFKAALTQNPSGPSN